MKLKTPDGLSRAVYVVLGVWIVNGALISYFLSQIDTLINVRLYDFNLQFSEEWAAPYWTSLRLIYAFTALQVGAIVLVVAWALVRNRKPVSVSSPERKIEKEVEVLAEVPVEKVEAEAEQVQVLEPKSPETGESLSVREVQEATQTEKAEEELKGNEQPPALSCPTCGKTFSRPLVMLDFGDGKTRLVDVCPYCKHILDRHSDD